MVDQERQTSEIQQQYEDLEKGKVFLSELVINVTLQKDPDKYAQNSLQRTVGLELGAKQEIQYRIIGQISQEMALLIYI